MTTDVESDGATANDPVETTLTTPVAGMVSVAETASQLYAGDFTVAGRLVEISAPAATGADPLVIGFRLDASVFPPNWPLNCSTHIATELRLPIARDRGRHRIRASTAEPGSPTTTSRS